MSKRTPPLINFATHVAHIILLGFMGSAIVSIVVLSPSSKATFVGKYFYNIKINSLYFLIFYLYIV